MFTQQISLIPPFTSEVRRNYEMTELNSDRSLFMTSFILLYPRVQNLKLQSTIFRDVKVSDVPYNTDPDVYSFHWVETRSNPDEELETIKDRFQKIESFSAVEKYIKEKFDLNIYVRIFPYENTVAIYMPTLNLSMWHLTQSFISKYFKIFEEKPLSEVELGLVRTLILKNGNGYTEAVSEIVNSEVFRDVFLKFQLDGFEKNLYKKKIETAQNEVDNVERKINEVLEQYRRLTTQQFDAKIKLEGLISRCDATEERTELQEYLMSNKILSNITISESRISFVVKTFLLPYLTESWETMSMRGAIFNGLGGAFADDNDAKLLLDAVFSSNHSLKLRMCAHINLDYIACTVNSDMSYNYSTIKDYVANPHLQLHNCFGQNGPDIVAQLHMGDVIGAIECAINCVKHVNVDEVTATFKPMLVNLSRFNGKCIVTEDGQELTIREAINYLKEKQNESDNA